MKRFPALLTVIHIFGLLLLCSCATTDSSRSDLPPEAPMNTGAGRGDYLFIELHSASGQPLVFAVDTGAYLTILDKSLEATLGQPIGQELLRYGWAQHISANQYQAPKLFLGHTEMKLGSYVVADDVRRKVGRPAAGILGTDCLMHYCLQLDFSARTIRFLDSDKLNLSTLGYAFPLTNSLSELTTRADAFGFRNVRFYVDTGDFEDGVLKPNLWKVSVPGKPAVQLGEIKTVNGKTSRKILIPEMEINGAAYTNVVMKDSSTGSTPKVNLLGLRLLARNLVTFDFPKQVMYLKPVSAGPLPNDSMATNTLTYQAARFLIGLKRENQLPGWKPGERGKGIQEDPSGEITFGPPLPSNADFRDFRKTFISQRADATTLFHYTVFRASPAEGWRLEKAWLADTNGKTIEEFPVK